MTRADFPLRSLDYYQATCKDDNTNTRPSRLQWVRERFRCVHNFSVAENLLSVSPDSNGHEVLAYCEWHFHVSLHVLMYHPHEYQVNVFKSSPRHTAGSSSPVFATSGVSSEDVNPIDGRYGYATIALL